MTTDLIQKLHELQGVIARGGITRLTDSETIRQAAEDLAAADKSVAAYMAERNQARDRVRHLRAQVDNAAALLTGIHSLLYPAPITTPDGRTMLFRPKDPDPHEVLQELSDRIRALPEKLAAAGIPSPQVAPDLRAAAQAVLDRWNSPKWEWLKHGPTADLMAALRTALDQYPKAGDATYSIDLDPAGIRALVCDAITGALALGAQNESPAPEGHWLGHFWQLGRQHDEWRATVWAVARALNCLPSTFSDANGHVLRAAERLMAERSAIPAPAAGQPKE